MPHAAAPYVVKENSTLADAHINLPLHLAMGTYVLFLTRPMYEQQQVCSKLSWSNLACIGLVQGSTPPHPAHYILLLAQSVLFQITKLCMKNTVYMLLTAPGPALCVLGLFRHPSHHTQHTAGCLAAGTILVVQEYKFMYKQR